VLTRHSGAYTGFSGADSADKAQWVQQHVDLSAYAGKQILVRFELLTDGSTTYQGMLVDDIIIPEINYSSDVETGDDGWQAEGWLRIDNVLPQTYLVQMITYGPAIRITRLLSPGDGIDGSWEVNVGDDIWEVVISISGMTEFTTEPALFDYTLTQN
jgi:immune inhibitor A